MTQSSTAGPVQRSRWAAVGAALAVTLGSGSVLSASAAIGSGERAVFVPITPCRIVDTRPATQVGPRATPLGNGETYTFAVHGTNGGCSIPADASAVVLNVTAVNPTASSYLTVFPPDAVRPTASNLNWVADQAPVPNAVTADLAGNGTLAFFNFSGTVDLAADIVGYYADHHHDDRYVRRQQTIMVSGLAMTAVRTGTVNPSTGCASISASTASDRVGHIALSLPVGARVHSVTFTMLEGLGTYTIALYRHFGSGPSFFEQVIASTVTGGVSFDDNVTRTLTPTTPEIVDPGEALTVRFAQGNSVAAVCHVAVTVDLSTSP